MKDKETISAFAKAIIARSEAGKYPVTDLGEEGEQAEETGTIAQLQQAYGGTASRVAESLCDEYDRISKEKIDERSPLYRHMTDKQRRAALREHREQLARQAYDKAVGRYTEVISERNQKLLERKRQAEEQLYGGEHNSEVLARLATGTDEQILAAARVASRTGNTELRRAAIATASERGLGEALVEVLDDKERDLLNELAQAPDTDALDRVADAERVLPAVDISRIMPAADGTT